MIQRDAMAPLLSMLESAKGSPVADDKPLELMSAICRFNAINAVKKAKSGHLGTSFSAMDIVTYLYFHHMNTLAVGVDDPNRDIYFSSKGHDVPGLYAVLYAGDVLPLEKVLKLRRFGGLDGHPDVKINGIEANSGSLGMGIAKGRGMAFAKRQLKRDGQVIVMLGDGELQEGQIWESLQITAHQGAPNLTVVIDHNKVQSDLPVDQIISLRDLQAKLEAFGWSVQRCDGHDVKALDAAFAAAANETDKPSIIIADTIKGKGVSFMEHPTCLAENNGLYRWHAGAPDDESFNNATAELLEQVQTLCAQVGVQVPEVTDIETGTTDEDSLTFQNAMGEPVSLAHRATLMQGVTSEYVAQAYGDALVEIADEAPEMVVLDGDLSADCRLRDFEHKYPDRFIECGIAEMDMTSMAGGLASQGLVPVVNSFASFLAARGNEQAYNNTSEGRKIVYAFHYAGMIPAGPGKSHQSIRDISLFNALPGMQIIQPCNAAETKQALRYAVKEAPGPCVLRLIIGPSPRMIELPGDYKLTPGHGAVIRDGSDAVIFGYGPVMLNEALSAAEHLAKKDISLKVVSAPWLNATDPDWLASQVDGFKDVYIIEDHSPVGGLADHLLTLLHADGLTDGRQVRRLAVEGMPACGTPVEALTFHGLDGLSISERIAGELA